MTEHVALNGQRIAYDPTPAEVDFIGRARAMVEDPRRTVSDLVALAYGPENPVLDREFFPGRPMVTLEVLENPVYQVLADLIDAKRARLGLIDLAAAAARCTIDVPAAARQLGISGQAVRAAIDARRLPAMYKNSQWWIDPKVLATYKVSGRARAKREAATAAEVEVVAQVGSTPGGSLSVAFAGGGKIVKGDGPEGRFPGGWERAMVKAKEGSTMRTYEIEPAPGASEAIAVKDRYVRGAFRVVKVHSPSAAANAAWKAFREGVAVS